MGKNLYAKQTQPPIKGAKSAYKYKIGKIRQNNIWNKKKPFTPASGIKARETSKVIDIRP